MAVVPPPSSWRTVGAAMVMTVLSRRSMISATSTMARTTQRQRYAGGSACSVTTLRSVRSRSLGLATAVADIGGLRVDRERHHERRSLRTLYVTNDVRVKR